MKRITFALFLSAAVVAAAVLAGCTNPLASATSGSLTIQIANNINARTLLPPIDMTPASYTVSGSGPHGSSFSQSTTGGSLTVKHLAFGDWTVTVNALNSSGTVIGSGQATGKVNTGETTTLAISVVPLSGNGSLDLSVSWTASQVEYPSISATLTPSSGSPIDLSFSVSGNTATYSSSTIPAGYSTLSLQLLDNGIPVMGAVEVARIVAGQTTTGSYTFTNVNQPGGTIQVNITPAMADPIPVSISGVPTTLTAGNIFTATASVSDNTTNVVYVWYLNGVSVGTGSSYTLPSTTAAGYYRLDVTAFSADGTRGGSATASFQVSSPQAGVLSFATAQNYAVTNRPIWQTSADVNGDGKPDIITVSSGSTFSVLLNDTPTAATTPSFALAQTFPVGSYNAPYAVAAADLNGDGKPDIITANETDNGSAAQTGNQVSVLLNTTPTGSSQASFSTNQNFTVGVDPKYVATADINGDGKPDIISANFGGGTGTTVSVLLNTTSSASSLSFAPQQTFAVGTGPWAVATCDLNGDGKPDLAVANMASGTVSVLVNTTSAGAQVPSFSPQQTFAVGSVPEAIGCADINGDGVPDLLVANVVSNTVSVLINTTAVGATSVSFSPQQTFSAGVTPRSIATGDFTGSGKLDIVVANVYNSSSGYGDLVSVLTNTTPSGSAAASFSAPTTFTVGSGPIGAIVMDVNGDGKPDIVSANAGDSTVSVLLNTSTG